MSETSGADGPERHERHTPRWPGLLRFLAVGWFAIGAAPSGASIYVHIDPDVLNRHPWMGVAIGGAGVLWLAFLLQGFWGEYHTFERAGGPTQVAIDALAVGEGETRLVTLRGGIWRCELAVETQRGPAEGWLSGPCRPPDPRG